MAIPIGKRLGWDDKWEFYQNKDKLHRWKRRSKNGKIVGGSCEGFVNYEDCLANAKRNMYNEEDHKEIYGE